MKEEYIEVFQKLGSELAHIRVSLGLSREEIARRSKIHTNYIQAIEEGHLELLPNGFYRKNFVREYCAQLDANDLSNEYAELFAKAEEEDKAVEFAPMNSASESLLQKKQYRPINGKPLLTTAAMLLILAAVLAVVFQNSIKSETKNANVMQLEGGTSLILKQKKAEEKKKQQEAEEKASKLAEERAKSEETEYSDATGQEENGQPTKEQEQPTAKEAPISENETPQLANNELYICAPKQTIKIKATYKDTIIYEGEIHAGKSMRFKVDDKNSPLRVRYENPNYSDVTFGGAQFKPLHPSPQGRSRYYWSDGTVTFTPRKKQKE